MDTMSPEAVASEEQAAANAMANAARKEKSVLQAKLTKLAIQIGYGGKSRHHSPTVRRA